MKKSNLSVIIIVAIGITLNLIFGIYYHNSIVAIISSILGLLYTGFAVFGSPFGYIFNITDCFFYSFTAYKTGLYGEVFVYLLMLLPIRIYGAYSWIKNKNEKTLKVTINRLEKKESILFSISSILIFFIFYFVLKQLHTRQLVISTLSIIFNLLATYLIARRYLYGFIAYFAVDTVSLILWGIPILNGDFSTICILFSVILWYILDTFGFVNWIKLRKEQERRE